MHAREVLNSIPPNTLRRYTKHLPKRPRLTKDEKELQHRMFAAVHAYQFNALSSSQGGAHFASGLFAFAAAEALLIMHLIEPKAQVKRTKIFTKLWKRFSDHAKKKEIFPKYTQFLLQQRVDDLFRLGREIDVFHERNLQAPVLNVLKARGFEGRLFDFVKESRNGIHPRWMLEANERYARIWDVSYSLEGMESFHADFALCAWTLHGQIAGSDDSRVEGVS